MKEKRILLVLGNVDDKYIEEMYAADEAASPAPKRHAMKHIWLIAAIIALMVFLMGSAVVYVIHMEDMTIGDQMATAPVLSQDADEFVGYEEVSRQVLTLSGVEGTPTYQAAQEWLDFKQSYDPDHAIMNSVWGNFPEYPEAYDAYSPYSQVMLDKLDEIAAKYDLKLLGEYAGFGFGQTDILYDALGMESILNADSGATIETIVGNCYEGGNFMLAFKIEMPEEDGQWPHMFAGDIHYCRKDYLSSEMLALNKAYDWEEWNYTTASGWDVLIIRSSAHYLGWIICERENDIISVTVEVSRDAYSDAGGEISAEHEAMTNRQMELIAEALDFGMQPQQPDMEMVKAALGE